MKAFNKLRIFFAVFMMISVATSAYAQDATPVVPATGNLNIVLTESNGAAVGGGCFQLIDATGATSSFCDDDADGRIELTNVPPGNATVAQTSTPNGYSYSSAVTVNVLPDQTVNADVVATPIVEDDNTPEGPELPDPNEGDSGDADAGDSDSGDADSGDADSGEADSEDAEADDSDADELDSKEAEDSDTEASEESTPTMHRTGDVGILAVSGLTVGCTGTGFPEGVQEITLSFTSDTQLDPLPVITYQAEDRFGNMGPETPLTMVETYNPTTGLYTYTYEGEFEAFEIHFDIAGPEGNLFIDRSVGCSLYNPIQLQLETQIKDGEGEDVGAYNEPGQVESGTSFFDTAAFVGDNAELAENLVGQTIYYYLYDTADCSGTPIEYQAIIGVNEMGQVVIEDSPLFTPTEDGVYNWVVVLPETTADGNDPERPSRLFAEARSNCGSETVVVGDIEVTIATTMQGENGVVEPGGPIPIGTAIYDTATILPLNTEAGGTVIYELFQGTCEDSVSVWESDELNVVNGVPEDSDPYTPTALGPYYWIVTYSGDPAAGMGGATTPCDLEPFEVVKASPEISTDMLVGDQPLANGETVPLGTAVTDTTLISDDAFVPEGGVLDGTVTYTLYHGTCTNGTVSGTAVSGPTTLDLNASGSFPSVTSDPLTLAGDYFWVVEYSGDDFNNPHTSDCSQEYFSVEAIETQISTVPQVQNVASFTDIPQNWVIPNGSNVQDTATVEVVGDGGSIPTGTVTYTLYNTADCSGTPVTSVTVMLTEDGSVPDSSTVLGGLAEDLPPGQYNWVAEYSGDTTHGASAGDCGAEQFFVGQTGEVGGFITTQVKNATGGDVADGATVPLGSTGYDTATFYGDIVNPDGTVAVDGILTYYVYNSGVGVCSDPDEVFELFLGAGAVIPGSHSWEQYRYETAGQYEWQAVFTYTDGEGNAQSVSSICGTETVNVNTVTPTFTTTMLRDGNSQSHPFRFTDASSVSDTVTLTYDQSNLSGLPAPTGTLTYTLYHSTNNTCSGEGVTVVGSPTVHTIGAANHPVTNTSWPASNTHTIGATDYGAYNWVVTFTPDTASAINYNSYTSGCNQETFRKDLQPTLTTEMFWSETLPNPDPDVLDNGDEETVVVGDYVHDTGQLTGFAPLPQNQNQRGTVTFTLYQSLSCTGQIAFGPVTVPIDTDGASITDWFQVTLFGPYSWKATYSGNNSGQNNQFTAPAESDCSTETFIASESDDDDPTMTTVMRTGSGQVIEHLGYIQNTTVNDQAVFFNHDNEMTGTIVYKLYRYSSVDCTQGGTEVWQSEVLPVTAGVAPQSGNFQLPNLTGSSATSGAIYGWIVEFQGTGEWSELQITSPCHEEMFRTYNSTQYSFTVSCTDNNMSTDPVNSKMSTVVELNPRDLNNTNIVSARIVFTPLALDLSPLTPNSMTVELEPGDSWTFDLGEEWNGESFQSWKRVTGTVEWLDPVTGETLYSGGTFRLSCNPYTFSPDITTVMYQGESPNGSVLPYDASDPNAEIPTVPFGSTVYDTTVINGSTVILMGTLTYTLYSDADCSVRVGQPTVHNLGSVQSNGDWVTTPYDELPPSENFTLTQAGTYYWVVEYSGDVNNNAATSECGQEVFTVEKANPQIRTEMMNQDTDSVITNGANVPIDSTVYDTAVFDPAGSASADAGGTVTYTLYRGPLLTGELICFTPWLWQQIGEPVEANVVNGVIEPTPPVTINNIGFYFWIAEYSGDANNAGVEDGNQGALSGCGLETFRIQPTRPTIETSMFHANEDGTPDTQSPINDGSVVPIDSVVTDTAEITGLSETATGTVVYQLYRGGVCTTALGLIGASLLGTWYVDVESGEGYSEVGEGVDISDVGTYTWIVTYLSGDLNNIGWPLNPDAQSGCGIEVFTVEPLQPVIVTTMLDDGEGFQSDATNPQVVRIDSYVHDTAEIEPLSNNAVGTVTYTLIRAESCDVEDPEVIFEQTYDLADAFDPVIGENGEGIKIENVGTYHWIVTFESDSDNNLDAISECGEETFVVEPLEPVIVTTMLDDGEGFQSDATNPQVVRIDSYVHDTATIEPLSDNALGNVTYTLIRAESCDDEDPEVIFEQTYDLADAFDPVIGENGEGIKIENVGTYHWIVTFESDSDNNLDAISECGEETFVVEPLEPVIVTTMLDDGEGFQSDASNPQVVRIDSYVHDTATIEPLSDNALGNVTYTLIRAESCDDEDPEVIFEQTYDLADAFDPVIGENGEGIKIENVGTYHWIVTFESDSDNNLDAISECGEETFVVNPQEPDIVTEMQFVDENGTVIENDELIAIDSIVRDTVIISDQSDNFSGEVTYVLIRAQSCDDANVPDEPEEENELPEMGIFAISIPDGAEVIYEETLPIADGIIPPSANVTIENVGTYYWIVNYSGDANNLEADSPCGDEWFHVEPAEPTIVTEMRYDGEDGDVILNDEIVPIDSVVIDTTVIEGQSNNATGVITYQLFRGETCEDLVPITEPYEVELGEGGAIENHPPVTITDIGTYQWIVTYSGDDNNVAAISDCGEEFFNVDPAVPTITTTMYFSDEAGETGEVIENEAIIPIDSVVTDTAIIEGQSDNATGDLAYGLYHGGVCEDGVLQGATQIGLWEFSLEDGLIPDVGEGIKIENAGLYTWIVTYSGDDNNESAISPCGVETFVVEPTTPTVVTVMKYADQEGTVIENGDMVERGSVVLDTAVISGQSDNATGTVTYQLYTDVLCTIPFGDPITVNLTNGEIPDSSSVTIPDAGSYYWVVTYTGDASNESAVSECGEEFFHVEMVHPAVLTTMQYQDGTVIENDEVVSSGNTVLDTAVLVGATDDASGTATYQLFSDAACTVPVTDPEEVVVANGEIPNSSEITISEPGSYYWVVSYSGDVNNAAAVSDCGEEFFHIEQVVPSVVTTMRYENGKLIENDDVVFTNNSVLDTAELIGMTDDASGTATYQLFSDAACTVPVTDPEEVVVTNGEIPNSSAFTVTEPGSYYWVVTYSGDANNESAISDCGEEFFQVENPPAPPATPPTVTELPDTGTGSQGSWLLPSLFGLVAAAFVASSLRLKSINR